MKIIPKTKKDFAWVNFTPKEIRDYTKKITDNISRDAEIVKGIPKEKRNFENTILAIDQMGENNSEDSPVSFLLYVSPDADIRKASAEFQEKVSKKAIDVSFDRKLYEAFNEYDKTREKLSIAETRLYDYLKIGFENQGFHLSASKQKELKAIKKKLATLGIKFTKNIDSYHDQILCTRYELKGLSENYISNLKIDKKTGKYIVTLAYSEIRPFFEFADSDIKRQELADKLSQRGGKENIKILKEILSLRKKEASILGYKDFASLEVRNLIAKTPENIKSFLQPIIKELGVREKKELNNLQKFVDKEYPGKSLKYFNVSYFESKMKERLFSYDQNEVKEYFELGNIIEKMFGIFGSLFGVSFRENKILPTWHEDAKLMDVIEKGKIVGHMGFDLYPRKNKYSHMGCAAMLAGHAKSFRNKEERLASVSVIVGNFPQGTKHNPSLLSIDEVRTMFHEFGHMLHGVLSRADIASQSGTNVVHDFVEVPSQLFENWMKDEKNLKFISKHFKTGKKISDELLRKVVKSNNFMKANEYYHTFIKSLQDLEMHSDKWNVDPLKLAKDFNKKYFCISGSPKSLFPAGWSHLVGYDAKYYSYMWALVYSYDIFSRFKKEGIMNKKVGMELRRKILEKGDSEDPIKLMNDFLGRKPNNKAFLEALK